MFKFAVIASMVVAGAAQADGFVCQTLARDLNVKVYNKTQPEAGVRNAAIMIFSDPAVQAGRKTIASFVDTKGTIINESARYIGKVDLRMSETSRKGELISGTKLGELKHVVLDIDFSYADPVAAGELVKGRLSLAKRDGSMIYRQVECARYLKN